MVDFVSFARSEKWTESPTAIPAAAHPRMKATKPTSIAVPLPLRLEVGLLGIATGGGMLGAVAVDIPQLLLNSYGFKRVYEGQRVRD